VVADAVAPPGVPRLDDATRGLMAALLDGDWAAADASEPASRERASGLIAGYAQYHLERGLKSLRHVDRRPA